MAEYQPFEPGVEVLGQSLLSWIDGTQGRIAPVFANHGITELDPDAWYPQQTILDVMREFSQMSDMVRMGVCISENAPYPPNVENLQHALMLLDEGYRLNHRNNTMGEYHAEQVGERHIVIEAKTPYPSDFDYGLIYGMATRYMPKGADLVISLDLNKPTRKRGDDSCTYNITW